MTHDRLHFVHISDTHLSSDITYNSDTALITPHAGAQALLRELQALPFQPDFILHTGDVGYDPYPHIYPFIRDLLSQVPYPIYAIAGNHDHPAALMATLMEREQTYYDVEVRGLQLVCLDSNGPAEPPAGCITDDQLAWLDALCSAPDARPLVVAVHHNPLPVGVPWLDDFMGLTNGEALHRILLRSRDRLRGVFHGHIHMGADIYRDGILYSAAPSPWRQFKVWPGYNSFDTLHDTDAQPGFNVITIDNQQTFIQRHRYRL